MTTGLPVVSTPVPPTEDYPSLIYVGRGQQFSEQIGRALEEELRPDAEDLWNARVQESRTHYRDRHIARVESDIGERLGAAPGPGVSCGKGERS